MRVADQLKTDLIDIVEWTDDSIGTMLWKFPHDGINYGAKLSVREFQQAIFMYNGQMADVYKPGLYTLTKENMPLFDVLNEDWKHNTNAPFKPEIYFYKTKYFIQQKWVADKVLTLRDIEFGLIRLKVSGTYDVHITDAPKLIQKSSGIQQEFNTLQVNGLLSNLIANYFSAAMLESKISLLDRTGSSDDELAVKLQQKINETLEENYGLSIKELFISTTSLPSEN